MWFAEDNSDYMGRFCLLSVLVGLGAPITDVVSEKPLSDELFDLVLECDAFLGSVANILVISVVLTLVSLRAVSRHCVWSFVDACMLDGSSGW